MFLLNEAGSTAVVVIIFILAILIFGDHLGLIIKYIVDVFSENNVKSEKTLAYAGYISILSMILLFVLYYVTSSLDYYNEVESINYYGLFAMIGVVLIAPALILADIKQIRWIKALSSSEREAYNIGLKDRTPLVYVILALIIINLALFGMNVEFFIAYIA
ncbi:MAG: hypothetical protein ACI35W_08115 [Anaeroplasmataceae bacterium]